MSLDPLVSIILLIYFSTVIIVLIVWLVITSGSNTSLPLPKIKNLINSRARNDPRLLPKRLRQSSPKSSPSTYSYKRKRQRSFSQEGKSRVFSRKSPSGPEPSRLSAKQRSGYSNRKNHEVFDDRLIEKNLHAKHSSKFSNDDFRGAKAKKQYTPIDIDPFENFAKNKK